MPIPPIILGVLAEKAFEFVVGLFKKKPKRKKKKKVQDDSSK